MATNRTKLPFDRYHRVYVRMWGDADFRTLSKPHPNAQSLFLYLKTGAHITAIPGLSHVGEKALAEALGWELKAFREAFREVFRNGLVQADWEARVVWLPKEIYDNPPLNPNIAKMWAAQLRPIPTCPLKKIIVEQILTLLDGYSKSFRKGFEKVLGEGFRQALDQSVTVAVAVEEKDFKALNLSSGSSQSRSGTATAKSKAEGRIEPVSATEPEVALAGAAQRRIGFLKFWATWPDTRRINRQKALAEWNRLNPSPELEETIIRAVEAAKGAWSQKEPEYIPHPWRWLKDRRWTDSLPAQRPLLRSTTLTNMKAAEEAIRLNVLRGGGGDGSGQGLRELLGGDGADSRHVVDVG